MRTPYTTCTVTTWYQQRQELVAVQARPVPTLLHPAPKISPQASSTLTANFPERVSQYLPPGLLHPDREFPGACLATRNFSGSLDLPGVLGLRAAFLAGENRPKGGAVGRRGRLGDRAAAGEFGQSVGRGRRETSGAGEGGAVCNQSLLGEDVVRQVERARAERFVTRTS